MINKHSFLLFMLVSFYIFKMYQFLRIAKGQNNVEIDFKNNLIVIDNHNYIGKIIFRPITIKCSKGNSVTKKRIYSNGETTYRLILHTPDGINFPLINIDKDFGSDKFVTDLDYLVKAGDE